VEAGRNGGKDTEMPGTPIPLLGERVASLTEVFRQAPEPELHERYSQDLSETDAAQRITESELRSIRLH